MLKSCIEENTLYSFILETEGIPSFLFKNPEGTAYTFMYPPLHPWTLRGTKIALVRHPWSSGHRLKSLSGLYVVIKISFLDYSFLYVSILSYMSKIYYQESFL